MSKLNLDLGLHAVDDLFTTEAQREDEKREKIMDIPLEELHPFKDHPFHVEDNEELRELAKSIADHGVVTPVIARPLPDGGYELISGHRRKAASQLAGMETLPVVVRELDDDAATIIMVDSNQQRENLLPSEKAFSYKMKLEAMKRKAGRPTKNNSAQFEQNLSGKFSVEILADSTDESRATIQRYIRLTNLIKPILQMVDDRRIAMSPAVEISYLPKKMQELLLDVCDMQDCTPSLSQAVRLKSLFQQGELNEGLMVKIMSEQKANQKDKLTFQAEKFAAYFPRGYTAEQMEQSIIRMLDERKRQMQRSCDDAR